MSSDYKIYASTDYVDSTFAKKSDIQDVYLSSYETKEDAQSKLNEAKGYTDTKTSNLASTTVVDNKISSHNTSASAHSDIRGLITALTTKVNNFLDVDDTTTDQLSEVIELIENNKGTLESLTSGKVNVSDIVNNLTTNVSNKPLSAAQGIVLKGLIDALQAEFDDHGHVISDITGLQSTLDGKVPTSRTINGKALTDNITLSADDVGAATSSHNHDDRYYTETEINTKFDTVSDSLNTVGDNITKLQGQLGNYTIEVLSVSEYESLSAYDSSTLYFCYED